MTSSISVNSSNSQELFEIGEQDTYSEPFFGKIYAQLYPHKSAKNQMIKGSDGVLEEPIAQAFTRLHSIATTSREVLQSSIMLSKDGTIVIVPPEHYLVRRVITAIQEPFKVLIKSKMEDRLNVVFEQCQTPFEAKFIDRVVNEKQIYTLFTFFYASSLLHVKMETTFQVNGNQNDGVTFRQTPVPWLSGVIYEVINKVEWNGQDATIEFKDFLFAGIFHLLIGSRPNIPTVYLTADQKILFDKVNLIESLYRSKYPQTSYQSPFLTHALASTVIPTNAVAELQEILRAWNEYSLPCYEEYLVGQVHPSISCRDFDEHDVRTWVIIPLEKRILALQNALEVKASITFLDLVYAVYPDVGFYAEAISADYGYLNTSKLAKGDVEGFIVEVLNDLDPSKDLPEDIRNYLERLKCHGILKEEGIRSILMQTGLDWTQQIESLFTPRPRDPKAL